MAVNTTKSVAKPRRLTDEEIGGAPLGSSAPVDPLTGLARESKPVRRLTDEELGQSFMKDTGAPSPFISYGSIKKYEKTLGEGNYHPELGVDYTAKQLARNQTGLQQFGNMLNQALIGQIVGGSIEGIGNLVDLKQWNNGFNGSEGEFGNWLTNVGRDLQILLHYH